MTQNNNSQQFIRNFCIIAHIDHGKSTLADRMLEITGTVAHDKMRDQILDSMDLEREKGITIKLQPVRMVFKNQSSEYVLNLIDTPGHVDFSYEVSRTLKAVEGAILLVDATQGIQAQTLANMELAQKNNLIIIPVVNKIDLPQAEVERTTADLAKLLNVDTSEVLHISAKTGDGVQELLNKIINKIPPPVGDGGAALKALIFDSYYNQYLGITATVRIFDGAVRKGDKILFFATAAQSRVIQPGVYQINKINQQELKAGDVGYLETDLKNLEKCRVGDTITLSPIEKIFSPISGFAKPSPNVFAAFFPTLAGDYQKLKESLQKYKLNDASFIFEPQLSQTLGSGFFCGFLGLLHLEIVKERILREYNLELVATPPSVIYKIKLKNGQKAEIKIPNLMPEKNLIEEILEPWVFLKIITPSQCIGQIMEMAKISRGILKNNYYLDSDRLILEYEIPLSSVIINFYDQLQNLSSGYASMSYRKIGYQKADLERIDVLLTHQKFEEFTRIVPKETMQKEAQNLAKKLKSAIPKQMFEIAIQVMSGGKILARENISPLKKDVIAKLYGGDITRKKKLLEKQKSGKNKMKNLGRVQLPGDVYLKIIKS